MTNEEIEIAVKEIVSQQDRIDWLKNELGLYWNNSEILKELKSRNIVPGLKDYKEIHKGTPDWLKNQIKIGYCWYKNDLVLSDEQFDLEFKSILL